MRRYMLSESRRLLPVSQQVIEESYSIRQELVTSVNRTNAAAWELTEALQTTHQTITSVLSLLEEMHALLDPNVSGKP